MQSRLESFVEAAINVVIGYFIALGSQLIIFPIANIHVSMNTHLWIGAWFAFISIVRSYVIRRWFNARIRRLAGAITRSSNG